MDGRKYKMARGFSIAVPLEDADKLIAQADGGLALLYLYIIRNGGEFRESDAARDLRRTEAEITASVKKLVGLGLISPAGNGKMLRPAPELPEYGSEEIVSRTLGSGDFKAVVDETQRIFGRMLSGSELKSLFGIYDHLSLPAEVMLMLINHCAEEYAAIHGEGRTPTMRRIEKEAYIWSDNEILTLESADDFLKRKKERAGAIAEMRRVLQIRNRDFSATERKYIEGWLAMGFTPDALEIAYDKTVLKTGGMQWKYMDSIIMSWHGKGLHTPEEIDAGDSKLSRSAYKSGGAPAVKGSAPERGDLERMKKILEIVKNS